MTLSAGAIAYADAQNWLRRTPAGRKDAEHWLAFLAAQGIELEPLVEANPYHDPETGRFTDKAHAGGGAAAPTRRLPKRVRDSIERTRQAAAWSKRAMAHELKVYETGRMSRGELEALSDDLLKGVAHWMTGNDTAVDALPDSPAKYKAHDMAFGAIEQMRRRLDFGGALAVYVTRERGRVTGLATIRRSDLMDYGVGGFRKSIVIDYLAGSPFPEEKGAGRRILAEVARRAAGERRYLGLSALDSSASFYESLGMKKYLQSFFYFTPARAERFARVVLDGEAP